MLTPYEEHGVRRSIYSILLGLAVMGPVVLIGVSFTDVRVRWVELIALSSAVLGIALLCVWGAIYAAQEPRRVRIVLIWIALLLFFMIGAVLKHPYVR